MGLSQTLIKKCTIAVACIGFFLGAFVYNMSQPVNSTPGNPVIVNIKAGMSASEIGTLLYQHGLVKNITVFRIIVHAQRLENSLQAGEYSFTCNMKAQTIISMISKGEVAYQRFTIPEGLTIDSIAKLLEEKKLANADKFRAVAKDYLPFDYIQPNEAATYKPEGFLFPDTYQVPRNINENDLIRTMVSQFNSQFSQPLRQQAKQRGLSIREVIILASLVEKEARISSERPIIAGVFLNRLKQDMPLQSCATIQYVLGYPKLELTVRDTEISSPYNTYLNMGLPPGPIANPGMASIHAVLYPAETNYLYFVADQNGKHHFSKTYEDHLAAIDMVSR